jgi:hypothetical protein
MAYPTVSAPYGLKPVNLIGGMPFAGSTRQHPITGPSNNYNTAIYYGDVVQLDTNGLVIITTLTTTAVRGVIGVFLGCSYTNPATKQKIFAQSWPGYASGVTDAVAFICDDPNTLFKVVNAAGSTVDGAASGLLPAGISRATAIPTNATLVLNTGNTATGNSRMSVVAGTTSTLPFRVVDVVPETMDASGNYVELIVKFNAGYHTYNDAVGI